MACTHDGKSYNLGDIICVDGLQQICADDGSWTKTDTECDGTEKNASPEETLDMTKRDGPVPKVITEDTKDVVLTQEQQKRTDYVRAAITFCLLGIFIIILILAGLVSAGIISYVPKNSWSQVKEFLNLALPAVTGLLGSAIGFYFGSRTEQRTAGGG